MAVGHRRARRPVAIRGWTETTDRTAETLARRVVGAGVRTLVYTDVARDGMLAGPDLAGARRLQTTGAGHCQRRRRRPGRHRHRLGSGPRRSDRGPGAVRGPVPVSEALDAGGRAPGALMLSRPRRAARRGAGRVHLSAARAARTPRVGAAWPAAPWPGRRSGCCCSTSAARSAAPRRPLVLLDASLSMGPPAADGGRRAIRRRAGARSARFGDERRCAPTTLPTRGRSLLAPALLAASASDRPVVVVSDGEIEDLRGHSAPTARPIGVRLFPREPSPTSRSPRVTGPARVTAGDSIALEVRGAGRRRRDARQRAGRGGYRRQPSGALRPSGSRTAARAGSAGGALCRARHRATICCG